MRRIIRALLVGSLAFGLIAAAASGATFGITLQDIVRIETSDASADLVVDFASCKGTYHIDWEIEGSDITGFTATRTEEDPDPHCADQSFKLFVSRLQGEDEDGAPTWGPILSVDTEEDRTDANGNIAATFIEPFDAGDGDEISLAIGPEAPELFG